MREGMQRITIAIEKLEKSSRNVANVVNSMNSDIVVVGGVGPETDKALSSVERFNFFNQTWTPLAELKMGRFGAAAVVFENQILVCGGVIGDNSDEPTDSIEVLDLNVNPPTWQEFAGNLPIEACAHKCVVYGNRLLIIGGGTNEKNFDTIYELLLVPPYSSKLLCHRKKGRAAHGVELFHDKVLIAGGKGTETDVEIFDITRNECVEMPPLPTPLWGMATVRRDDTMLLVGGQDNENNSNEIIEYDFKSGQTKNLAWTWTWTWKRRGLVVLLCIVVMLLL
ncbi:phage structural [Paramuricea clavata]|uniref:Phage structural n=1 Tax=Paramuricea clavata TaxID=317549 RepID=A0A6S7IZD9_PARCT|nr:phage structural [Paramuricea clavata]